MSELVGKLFRNEPLSDAERKQLSGAAMAGAVAALSVLSVNKGLITALSEIVVNTGRFMPELTPKVRDVPKVQSPIARLDMLTERLQKINRELVVRTATLPTVERPSNTVH